MKVKELLELCANNVQGICFVREDASFRAFWIDEADKKELETEFKSFKLYKHSALGGRTMAKFYI